MITQEGGAKETGRSYDRPPSLLKLADGGGDFDVLAFLQFPLTFNEIVHAVYYSLHQVDL